MRQPEHFAPTSPHFAPGEVSPPADDFAPPLQGGEVAGARSARTKRDGDRGEVNGGREPSSEPTTAISENVGLPLNAAALEGQRLVTTEELAAYLGVERSWVYEHASELDPRRLGSGPKARLRFSIPRVDLLLTCYASRGSDRPEKPEDKPNRTPRRPRRAGTNAALLPIRGASAPSS